MKVVIGLGDSWTQGEGGVPPYLFERGKGRVDNNRDDDDQEFLKHEHENSWVNQLCVKYFTDHKPYNLGMRGYGNRGAVKNLHYSDIPFEEITGGYLIFLLSSKERYDFTGNQTLPGGRRRFLTMYPQTHTKLYRFYTENIYSEFGSKQDLMFNIIEAQTIAKLYKLDFYFAYAFDNGGVAKGDPYGLSKKIDWSKCLTPYKTYMEVLCEKEGIAYDAEFIRTQKQPLEYVTNCLHPTIKGYEIITDHIHNTIMKIKNGDIDHQRDLI